MQGVRDARAPGVASAEPALGALRGQRVRTARRAVIVSAGLNLVGMSIYAWMVWRRLPDLPFIGVAVALCVSAVLLVGFLAWPEAPLRASEAALTVHNLAIVAGLWVPSQVLASSNDVWMPFEPHKLGMLAVALLLPWFHVGLLNIAVFCGAALLGYESLAPGVRHHLPAEPWASLVYAIFAVGVLSFRTRQFALEAAALRDDADRAARQLIEAVVDCVPITLHAMDRQGRFLLSEGRGLEAIGLRSGELVGRNAHEIFGDEPFIDAEGVVWSGREVLARVFSGEVLRGETPYRGRELESTFVPLRDARGVIVRAAGVSYDVTEARRLARERAQALAHEAAARKDAQAAAERLAFLYEATGRLLGNPAELGVMLQRIADLVVSRRLADACVIHVIERDGSVRRIATAAGPAVDARALGALDPAALGVDAALATGRARTDDDLPRRLAVCAAGGAARALVTVPLHARSEVAGAVTLVACRAALRYGDDTVALVSDLAQRIALVLHNVRLFEDAERAVQLRDEFISAASHELRTPLTPLLASMQALEQVAARGELAARPELSARMLARARRQAQRLRRLVESMLEVVELQAGRLELRLQPTDLAALTREVCARFADAMARAGCALSLSAPGPVIGCWDRRRLAVVVEELLSNAVKYGAGRPIEISVAGDTARARVAVTDHGIGVPPEHAPTLFRRFERGVSVHSYGGLGLGLYIAKQIIDAHGGTIAVRSGAAEPGATFIVELPVGPAAAREG